MGSETVVLAKSVMDSETFVLAKVDGRAGDVFKRVVDLFRGIITQKKKIGYIVHASSIADAA